MPETTATDTLTLASLPFWQWDSTPYPVATGQEVNVGIPLDSLLPHRELPDTVFRTSLFTHHSLPVQHRDLHARADVSLPAWVFGALLLVGILTVLYYRLRKIKLGMLFHALVDNRAFDRLVRDCNLNRSTVLFPMGMLLMAAAALPAHTLFLPQTGPVGYLALFAAAGLLYLLRNAAMRLLGNVFDKKQPVAHYITNAYLFHLADATVVATLLPFYLYLPGGSMPVAAVAGGFVALSFLWRLVRGMKTIFAQPDGSCFFLFYYLCTVELIPVLVGIKLFISQ